MHSLFLGCVQDHSSKTERISNTILISSGATDIMDSKMLKLVDILTKIPDINITLPPRLYSKYQLPKKVSLFDFSHQAYRSCKLVICRPGIGTLTDCVSYGIPILAHGENDNLEMIHNSSIVEHLEVGRDISSANPEDIAKLLNEILYSNTLELWIDNLKTLDKGGLSKNCKIC